MLAKIAEIPEPDRVMAERLQRPHLSERASSSAELWYGCPRTPRTTRLSASSTRAEVQVEVSDVRLQRRANLDEGAIWPTAFALT
jgi:hypothetical protein